MEEPESTIEATAHLNHIEKSGVEILCHNLSHSDLVLALNDVAMTHPNGRIFARPQFSSYREISGKVVHVVSDNLLSSNIETYYYPVYSRQKEGTQGQYPVLPEPSSMVVPVGFDMRKTPVSVEDMSMLRFRGGDKALLSPTPNTTTTSPQGCVIEAAFFPLIAVLLPKWLQDCDPTKKKIVFIVSGRGTPNDSSSRMVDNSTKFSGVLITKFIQREYPDINIFHVHSTTNIFRYDENIAFVKRELLPMIDSIRDEMASKLYEKWKDSFRLTLSFADGSSARISAINAALKPYRPNYMHFWQLKTFWNETKICGDDIDCHSFEEISTEPAVPIDQTENTVRLAVAELMKFKEEFEYIQRAEPSLENDLSSFWLRKTKKPVLAVLLVQKPGQRPKLYRGTNMEVSMPTGSLCAERNVIGSALADDLTLKRQDLKVVCVYSAASLSSKSGGKEEHIMTQRSNSGVTTSSTSSSRDHSPEKVGLGPGVGVASSVWGYLGEGSTDKNILTNEGRREKNVHFAASSPPSLLRPPSLSISPYDSVQALVAISDPAAAPSSSSSSSSSLSVDRHREGTSVTFAHHHMSDDHELDEDTIRLDDCFSGAANNADGAAGTVATTGNGPGSVLSLPMYPPSEPYPPLGNKRARTGSESAHTDPYDMNCTTSSSSSSSSSSQPQPSQSQFIPDRQQHESGTNPTTMPCNEERGGSASSEGVGMGEMSSGVGRWDSDGDDPVSSYTYSSNVSRAVTSGKRAYSVDSGSLYLGQGGQGLGPGLGPYHGQGLVPGTIGTPVNNGFGLGGLVLQGLGPYQGQGLGQGHCRSPVQGHKRNIMNIPIGRPQAKVPFSSTASASSSSSTIARSSSLPSSSSSAFGTVATTSNDDTTTNHPHPHAHQMTTTDGSTTNDLPSSSYCQLSGGKIGGGSYAPTATTASGGSRKKRDGSDAKLTRRLSCGANKPVSSSLVIWDDNNNNNNHNSNHNSNNNGNNHPSSGGSMHVPTTASRDSYESNSSQPHPSSPASPRNCIHGSPRNHRGSRPRGNSFADEDPDTPFARSDGSLQSVTTIVVEEGDMNPLKPCGACIEWLKKIAEVNPAFSVVTFTDAQCTGVYVEQVSGV